MQSIPSQMLEPHDILSPLLLLSIVIAAAISWILKVVVKGWKARSVFVELQKQDMVNEAVSSFTFC